MRLIIRRAFIPILVALSLYMVYEEGKERGYKDGFSTGYAVGLLKGKEAGILSCPCWDR